MKITHITGQTIDTDQMPDVDAMVFEKICELRKICEDNNRPFLLFINPVGLGSKYTIFWHHLSRDNWVKENDVDGLKINFGPLLGTMKQYVESLTNNDLTITEKSEFDDE